MSLGGLDAALQSLESRSGGGVGGLEGWWEGGVVGLRVHLQLTHAEPSSLGSVGGRGGLVERTSVHLLEREARRPFKMGNYEEACDYL